MKMVAKIIIVILSCMCIARVRSATSEPLYRADYRYVSQQDAFYKVHRELRDWHDAFLYCTSEGAALLYPKNTEEATLFQEIVNELLPNASAVWVGAHDLFALDIFVDVDGTQISDYYAPWSPGEPNYNRWNPENCVEVRWDFELNNIGCAERRPFVCKRLNKNITINPICQTPDGEYFPNSDLTSCYKVHKQAKSWTDAYSICTTEQGYLSIINDKAEADFVIEKVKSFMDEVPHSFNRNYIAIGFHDKIMEGVYQTIHGENLNTVYHEWSSGQNTNNQNNEDCGSLTIDGFIDDVDCQNQLMLFVCEKDI